MPKKITAVLTIILCSIFTPPPVFCNPPEKIISLAPSLTETVYLLGAADQLIGYTTYCRKPDGIPAKEIVASAVEVNVEKVVSLNPDIILATSLTNAKAITKLQQLGLQVKILPAPQNFAEICRQFQEISKILNKSVNAEEILNKVYDKVSRLKNETKTRPKQKVFFQIGARPLFTVTKNSFINDFIEFAGGENIAKDIAGNGLFSREQVLASNPDCIIIAEMGIAGTEEKKTWQKFTNLNAVKNNRIHIIASEKICSPTPRMFADTLEEIRDLIHPELKNTKSP